MTTEDLSPILASPAKDPGCIDLSGRHAKALEEHGDEVMHNLKTVPNDGLVVSEFPDRKAAERLSVIKASWTLAERPRSYVCIIQDMQTEYAEYIDYVVPDTLKVLNVFREQKLPVLWTNWIRKARDGMYGGVDRFYGPRGVKNQTNPCYVHLEGGEMTVPELAPKTPEEMSCMVRSIHLSKFADLDEDGMEILYPILKAWGVDTIVMTGAWTDDCLAATVLDAVDKYGFDVALVTDAVATATIHGNKMVECLLGSSCLGVTAAELVKHLNERKDLTLPPKAPLRGSVRHSVDKSLVAVRK